MTTINGDNLSVPGIATLSTAAVTTLTVTNPVAALVASVLAATRFTLPITSKSADYPATLNDEVILVTASGKTITLPTAVGCAGKRFLVKLTASGTGTVATTGGENIDGATPYTLSGQYKFVEVVSDGSAWNITGSN